MASRSDGEGGVRQPLGLYLAVPFCRSKCSFCNFASQVYPASVYLEYCELLAREVELAAEQEGLEGAAVDSVYWGGGTPTLLPREGIARIGRALRRHFALQPSYEHTMEAAPGTLGPAVIETLTEAGVNRLSLGVQSFVDLEARSMGRLHRRETVIDDIERLRANGFSNFSLDLIAGLPHQTADSWQISLAAALETGAPHLSVYMLEVDEESRLGREVLAGGTRYHAHALPDEDFSADAYEAACERLEAEGRQQYEISNFAAPGRESRHNRRYWQRAPYRGFGVDAHSMLASAGGGTAGEVRFANPDGLEAYCAPLRQHRLPRLPLEPVSAQARIEEMLFLGLRCNAGVPMHAIEAAAEAVAPGFGDWLQRRHQDWQSQGLAAWTGDRLCLTARGRLLSNRVFADCLGFPAD